MCYCVSSDVIVKKRGHISALFWHSTATICVTIRLFFTSQQLLRATDSGHTAAVLFCSHKRFYVKLTCQCAQNCHTPLKALNAMCNSFNTRPCRYPYHCCNGVFMPPCIPRTCTGQLVIHLIYSSQPAVAQTALRSCCADGWRTWPDTPQPSSFRGELMATEISLRTFNLQPFAQM